MKAPKSWILEYVDIPEGTTTDELTARRTMFRWLTRYNTKRRHSWCRYQSPNTYERTYTDKLALRGSW